LPSCGLWDILGIQMIIQGELQGRPWDKDDEPGSPLVADLGSLRFVSGPSGPADARDQPSGQGLPSEQRRDDAAQN
jgi:hypothetical protein